MISGSCFGEAGLMEWEIIQTEEECSKGTGFAERVINVQYEWVLLFLPCISEKMGREINSPKATWFLNSGDKMMTAGIGALSPGT